MFLDGVSQVLEEHMQAVNIALRKHMSLKRMMYYVSVMYQCLTKLIFCILALVNCYGISMKNRIALNHLANCRLTVL